MTPELEELKKLAERLRQIVKKYKAKNPLRTADFHGEDCACYRCAVDACDAAVNALPELLAKVKRLEEALRLGKIVMDMLEEHGPSIVPHLLDTDENAGQRFRDALARAALNQETKDADTTRRRKALDELIAMDADLYDDPPPETKP